MTWLLIAILGVLGVVAVALYLVLETLGDLRDLAREADADRKKTVDGIEAHSLSLDQLKALYRVNHVDW